MTDLYGVVGKPVLHSRSPQMHNSAFRKNGMDAFYVRLAAETAHEALRTAREMGVRGLNVTAPFKEDMAALVEPADDASRRLGAVNTVIMGASGPAGYNTDPDGVAMALREGGVRLRGSRAVVLGAGGAAKAAILALMREGASVTIANRTGFKAEKIAQELGCGMCGIGELEGALAHASVLVSALSTSERVVPPEMLRKGLAVLDANYSSETSLARDAAEAGCRVIDGKEWLLHQGAEAFRIFTGKEAPLGEMRNGLSETGDRKRETGNIALIGMMGSGKNAAARALAEKTGTEIIDIDAEVERKAGKTIKGIFDSVGQEGFRRMESREVAAAAKARKKIINCGGGAILETRNREALNGNANVVWLWAEPGTMASRVAGDGSRPLLEVPAGEKKEVLGRVLAGRLGFYAGTSDLVIDTGRITPKQVAERILYEIH